MGCAARCRASAASVSISSFCTAWGLAGRERGAGMGGAVLVESFADDGGWIGGRDVGGAGAKDGAVGSGDFDVGAFCGDAGVGAAIVTFASRACCFEREDEALGEVAAAAREKCGARALEHVSRGEDVALRREGEATVRGAAFEVARVGNGVAAGRSREVSADVDDAPLHVCGIWKGGGRGDFGEDGVGIEAVAESLRGEGQGARVELSLGVDGAAIWNAGVYLTNVVRDARCAGAADFARF